MEYNNDDVMKRLIVETTASAICLIDWAFERPIIYVIMISDVEITMFEN